jgi:hypothetical protein
MKKTIFASLFIALNLLNAKAQDKYTLVIDSVSNIFNSDISFPYWLNANQTVRTGPNIKSISILEFKLDTSANNALIFQKVINLKSWGRVPTGKVWKLESIGLGPTLMTIPAVFSSPKSYLTPGSYTFTVPAGITTISVEIWGGGGNGSYITQYGGGGGGYGFQVFQVNPLDTFRVVVGGAAGTSSFSNKLYATGGGNGGSSGGAGGYSNSPYNIWGGNGGYCSAGGGNGGNGGAGGKSWSNTTGVWCGGQDGFAPGGGGSGAQNSVYPTSGARGQVIIYW